jgi:hypothetical protein
MVGVNYLNVNESTVFIEATGVPSIVQFVRAVLFKVRLPYQLMDTMASWTPSQFALHEDKPCGQTQSDEIYLISASPTYRIHLRGCMQKRRKIEPILKSGNGHQPMRLEVVKQSCQTENYEKVG